MDSDWFEIGSAATKAHGEFLFNGANKTLSWDDDGAGAHAAMEIASFTLPTGMSPSQFLHASDFLIV